MITGAVHWAERSCGQFSWVDAPRLRCCRCKRVRTRCETYNATWSRGPEIAPPVRSCQQNASRMPIAGAVSERN